jgi:pyridoxal phosphate enzyme (YggS family)
MSIELSLQAETIQLNYQRVLEGIERASRIAGREPSQIRLVVVTKEQSLEKVRAVIAAGARHLGENYVEDAVPKIRSFASRGDLSWHMIGHIQSRKARLVCENFHWIHSLDSIKLATRMNIFLGELDRQLPVMIELNVSGEESKFGFPAWDDRKWSVLKEQVSQLVLLPSLLICGLMTIAPYSLDPEAARPYYRRLREIQERLVNAYPKINWSELSMGMSMDYEVAIQEGATVIRVCEAILGKRPI